MWLVKWKLALILSNQKHLFGYHEFSTLGLSIWLFFSNIIILTVVIFTGKCCFHLCIVVHYVTVNYHNDICRCRQANNRLPAVKSVMSMTSPLTSPISPPLAMCPVTRFCDILEQCDVS